MKNDKRHWWERKGEEIGLKQWFYLFVQPDDSWHKEKPHIHRSAYSVHLWSPRKMQTTIKLCVHCSGYAVMCRFKVLMLERMYLVLHCGKGLGIHHRYIKSRSLTNTSAMGMLDSVVLVPPRSWWRQLDFSIMSNIKWLCGK